MSDLPKLVRNKIPEIIAESNRGCSYRIASREEMRLLLFNKLKEESEEFLEKPCVEEAADIYEVFLAILSHWDIDFSDVINHSYYKRDERGGFSNGVILESVD
ncbi:MAG: phosphoribosyl-ATP pyrophosphohydrolase [Euryarchaeota archaeon]|nr:phosphoribosyl-ATP pyrophosphohydrolase [Euryarchaeota archaeon]|tara:strand:- start:9702 stop:10010 length:309 start_codon:yes stop_codon:yes gene_type:complete